MWIFGRQSGSGPHFSPGILFSHVSIIPPVLSTYRKANWWTFWTFIGISVSCECENIKVDSSKSRSGAPSTGQGQDTTRTKAWRMCCLYDVWFGSLKHCAASNADVRRGTAHILRGKLKGFSTFLFPDCWLEVRTHPEGPATGHLWHTFA